MKRLSIIGIGITYLMAFSCKTATIVESSGVEEHNILSTTVEKRLPSNNFILNKDQTRNKFINAIELVLKVYSDFVFKTFIEEFCSNQFVLYSSEEDQCALRFKLLTNSNLLLKS